MQAGLSDPRRTALVVKLIECRKARGLTQRQLAAQLGWSQSRLAQAEAGQRRFGLIELLDISAALGVSVQVFVRAAKRA